MEHRSVIERDKETEQVYLSLLNNYFKTITYEKHTDAMMNIIFTNARTKVLGKNFDKKRISRKKAKKIREEVSRVLRGKYGKWVSLSRFKIKSREVMLFATNLDKVFTVPGYGKLYGAYYKSVCGNIFFTSHSLQRFEERTDKESSASMSEMFKAQSDLDATSVDILCGLIFMSAFIHGRVGDYIHLALPTGILVLEDLGDVFIGKTFLAPGMIKEVEWYRPIIDITTEYCHNAKSFATVVNGDTKKSNTPLFVQNIKELIKGLGDTEE